MIKNKLFLIVSTVSFVLSSFAFSQDACGIISPAKDGEIATPASRQLKWHEAEIGVIFHYDLHVFDGKRYSQTANRISPIKDPNIFNPTKLDCEQWVLAAKAAGAKFAVITATHETGFAIYQSEVNPFCLKRTKWREGKGDVIEEFVKACRKHGIAPGIYIGIRWNSHLNIFDFKAQGKDAETRQADYRKFCEDLTRELCTKYGELFMIWYDGGAADPRVNGPDVLPIVAELQPNCLFYHNAQRADFRWGMSESGTVPYPNWSSYPVPSTSSSKRTKQQAHHGDPEGKYWVPAMADTPLRGANGRHEWFWEPNDENAVYSLESLMDMYEKSVGRNATLILGLTPNPEGLMPAGDVARLKEFGDAVKTRWGRPIKSTTDKNETSIIFDKVEKISAVVLQEPIEKGHQIRSYEIDVQLGNGSWEKVAAGTSVGFKRIEKFSERNAKAVRVRIIKFVGVPELKSFSAF